MPNGGTDNCMECRHFSDEMGLCMLRGVAVKSPPWTTCRNYWRGDTPDGPIYSIDIMVHGYQGAYIRLPYLEGRRPFATKNDGEGSVIQIPDANGDLLTFETPEDYMTYYIRVAGVDPRRGHL
jgi:ribulose bisphosphate carboxylase small subunit